eukprot:GGOE01061397.1.p1 GENE.GGOE01061397.1~~GGOE01061397.1.p1  ORF type:complete len:324 (-),score=74.38 GGOE01061397.1:113-1057(-)
METEVSNGWKENSAHPQLGYVRPVAKAEAVASPRLELREIQGPANPPTKHAFDDAEAFIVRNLLSSEECAELCSAAEEMGFSFWNPDVERKDFRNADTVEITHNGVADLIWSRIQSHVPPVIHFEADDQRCETGMEGDWHAKGCSNDLLFVRYRPGGHFSPHTDGYTIHDFNCRSLYSVVVYLNDCPMGGGTALLRCQEGYVRDDRGRFRWPQQCVMDRAPCEAGTCLVFFQDLPHEGEPVGDGCEKIIIRMDVLYERVPQVCNSATDLEAYRLFREAELLEADGKVMEAAQLFRRIVRLSPDLADRLGIYSSS